MRFKEKMILKRTLQLMTVVFTIFMAVSCASTSKAPQTHSDEAKTFNAPADRGRVYLYRTGRVVGAAVQHSVKINGKDAGGTGPGTFFKWDLKPGTYTFRSATGESSAVVQLEVEAGKVYFLRQDARLGIDKGRVTLKEVSRHKGENEIKDCKLLVSSYLPE